MTGPNYWRDVQKRMAAGGAYDHGVMDAHTVDPPVPDAWDECGGCGHDRDDHFTNSCEALMPGQTACQCEGFVEPS